MLPSRRPIVLLAVTLAGLVLAASAAAQTGHPAESVGFVNPRDGVRLTGRLSLPDAMGPHPGVVLLSVAGTDRVVGRLVADGYAVLEPSLRGFVEVEPLLRATYDDLAGDVGAAVAYMRSLASVRSDAIAVVAQGDNTPQAMRFAGEEAPAVPLVLLAPPAFPGVESFQLEQRWIAEAQGVGPSDLEALDAYVLEIGEIARAEREPFARQLELERLRARSAVSLPRNAAFPADDGQMRFLASRIWHDRLTFEPEQALARLGGSVLVLIGTNEANTPMDRYLTTVRVGLAAGSSPDATVCRIPGRTRHTFSDVGVETIVTWLDGRIGSVRLPERAAAPRLDGCLEDDEP